MKKNTIKMTTLILTGVLLASSLTACGQVEEKEQMLEVQQTQMQEIIQENQNTVAEIQEEPGIAFDSYEDAAAFMQTHEYRVESAQYSEDALSLMYKLISTMMLEKDMSLDMSMLSEEQRLSFNYNLLNEGFGYGYIPKTEDVVTGAPVGELYDTEVLNSYLFAFYEGGKVGDAENNLLQQYESYTVYMPSDAAERHTFDQYSVYQYGDYLLIEAPCYYADAERMNSMPSYTASVLFKITENELYPVQLVHVNTYEKELDESILLKEDCYSCFDIENENYSILISNIRDYGTYQKFDMKLTIETTQDMGRTIDCKTITCYDAILEGNVAKFESDEEMYNPDAGYSSEEVEVNNGFYGEFTIQEDGSLLLTYGVEDNSDGWILNRSKESIILK